MSAVSWAAVARFGGIGDNLIASAVLPGLRAEYGRVEVISQHPQHVVFENNPYVDKLSVYRPGDIRGDDALAWHGWFEQRAKEYAFFAHLSHTCEASLALFRTQTQFYWSPEMRRQLCGRSYTEYVADVCGVPHDALAPGFFPTDAEREGAEASKRPYGPRAIGWVLSGTRIDKIYPYAPMAVARLIREVGPVILLGAPSEKEVMMARTIEGHVLQQNGSVDGLGIAMSPSFENETWPIRRVLTMAQHCDLVIGPDTGPMWAVAMCDMPKVMLLSHASPENITKRWRNTVTLHANPARVDCWPCHRLIDVPEHCRVNASGNAAACISDIGIERLIATVKERINAGKEPDPDARGLPADDDRAGAGERCGDDALSSAVEGRPPLSSGRGHRRLGNGVGRAGGGDGRAERAPPG